MSKGDPIFIYFYFFHFFFSNWGVLKFFFCWEDKDDFLDFILFFSFNVSFIPLSSFPCSLLPSCVRFHLIFILLWLATISFWLLRKIRIFSKNNKQKENLDKFFLFFKQQQKNQNKKSLLPILDFGGAALSGPEGFCGPVFFFFVLSSHVIPVAFFFCLLWTSESNVSLSPPAAGASLNRNEMRFLHSSRMSNHTAITIMMMILTTISHFPHWKWYGGRKAFCISRVRRQVSHTIQITSSFFCVPILFLHLYTVHTHTPLNNKPLKIWVLDSGCPMIGGWERCMPFFLLSL